MEQHPHLRHPRNRTTHLLLVRHGRTEGNRRRILQGSTDIPLDRLGLLQAGRIADRIADEHDIDLILSSPLSRALTTAKVIGSRIGREPVIVQAITEMSFGECEGLTVEQVASARPELYARLRDVDDFDLQWPGGESRRGFYDRVWGAFHQILHEHEHEKIVVVAHGGVIGAFLAMIRGQSPNAPEVYDLANCGLTHLEVRGDHTVVHLRNDAIHLDGLQDPHADEDISA